MYVHPRLSLGYAGTTAERKVGPLEIVKASALKEPFGAGTGLGATTAESTGGLLANLTSAVTGIATIGATTYAQYKQIKAQEKARKAQLAQERAIREAEVRAAEAAMKEVALERARKQAGIMGMDTNTLLMVGGVAIAAMVGLPMLMKGGKS